MRIVSSIGLILVLFGGLSAHAEVLNSTNFKILDPVVSAFGDRSTSTNFILLDALTQIGLGTSTAASFQLNPGYLTWPVVTLPTVTATAGDGETALLWTTSEGQVGWTVSGYTVGQSTTSGGPYTYTSVGNVTTSTRTGLNNGTTYYFVLLPEDAFSITIATTTEVSAAPVAGATPAPPSRGGGGPLFLRGAEVVFRGEAPPLGTVSLLKGFQIVSTAITHPNGQFELLATGLSEGVHTFGITGQDSEGRRSRTLSFTVEATTDATTAVQNILLPPTISTDKQEVKSGEILYLEGQGAPDAYVSLFITSPRGDTTVFVGNTQTDRSGMWRFGVDTSELTLGTYSVRATITKDGTISLFSFPVEFIVGLKTVFLEPTFCPLKGDLNTDCRVNLIDFSIAAFFYLKPLDAVFREKEIERLSGDGVIDLIDFSLMAFYWTG